MTAPLLQTNGLSFGYEDAPVFSGISLDFTAGMTGIIGPNGAGKTTLLRLIMGLLQPEAGDIFLKGKKLKDYPRRDLARLIALVPQDTQIGYAFSVREIVTMGRNPYLGRFQPPQPQDVQIVESAMRQTRIEHLADRPINTLSGGERQRVLIARAVAQETPIILLDEATANLDLCHQLEVMELVHTLAQKGHLVIATIHDLSMASRYCDRIVLLADGGVQADGAPAEVISESNLRIYFSLNAAVSPAPPQGRGLTIVPIAPAI